LGVSEPKLWLYRRFGEISHVAVVQNVLQATLSSLSSKDVRIGAEAKT